MRSRYWKIAAILVVAACLIHAGDDAEQRRVLDGMMHEQTARLGYFESYARTQRYSVTTSRFGVKAEMVVRVHRDRIKGKTYEVISRTGSPTIQTHVFDALLEAEMATSHEGGELLTPANYSFHLIGQEDFAGNPCYVLETIPRHKDKRLLKGRIWLDTDDFGVVHVEGRPSESLSFWVGKPMIVQYYTNLAGHWWAARRHSFIDNFLLGKSDLEIDYSDYQFDTQAPPNTAALP